MRPHLLFRNPVLGVERFRQHRRFVGEEVDEEEKNYEPMKNVFAQCRESYFADKEARIQNRNSDLNIPAHIEYIILRFFNSFNSNIFENYYRAHFGIAPIVFKEFNSVGVFAIVNPDLFENFINQLDIFLETDIHTDDPPYDKKIKFIKEFYFLSTERIIAFEEIRQYIILNLTKNPEIFRDYTNPIEQSLRDYLRINDIEHHFDTDNEAVELTNVTQTQIKELIDNFDIIHTANSYSAGVIRPSLFNTPIRDYGFSISNIGEDLPLIGIIDTGISNQTPLAPIIVNEGNTFDLTGTSSTLDEANHGTAVGLLAALGSRLIPEHVGEFEADAKLVSIKILNETGGIVRISDVERMIREAYQQFNCKLFTLTITFNQPLKDNSNLSEYASMLDKLADELNILVFISTGNSDVLQDTLPPAPIIYPNHFIEPKRNICSPADSFNNMVVGAIADNFEGNGLLVLAGDSNFPASYTRKFNIGYHEVITSSRKKSKHLVKPDIMMAGGDYDNIISCENTGIKVLSTITGIFYDRSAGTSLSTPLAANLAARLLKTYPSLGENMQSIKALILNSASIPNYGNVFNNAHVDVVKLVGKGLANELISLYSNENSVTLLLEDTISPQDIKTYSLNLPEYLNTLPHRHGVIEITATLCYKISPTPDSHISYCPICISFGFFNNTDINGMLSRDIKIRNNITWSEDYYFGAKMLSNSQKMCFRLGKDTLISQENTIRIALNCKIHKLLNNNQSAVLNKDYPFSLVIKISEVPEKGNLTGNLYSELEAVNTLENFAGIDLDLIASV
jgi:hypothetical protein